MTPYQDGAPLELFNQGVVVVVVHNVGSAAHRLAIWDGDGAAAERCVEDTLIAVTDFVPPGGVTTLQISLEPSRYLLTCLVPCNIGVEMSTQAVVHIYLI